MASRALIVGLGQIGLGYDLHLDAAMHVYSHARAFSMHPGFKLVGGVDSSAERRTVFEQSYGAAAYADLDDGLAQRPDVVAVAVPTEFHGRVMDRILAQTKPKAILCEKPLSQDLDEAAHMVEACRSAGVALYVNYIRRTDAAVVEVKRRIVAGEMAGPLKGVCWYSKGFRHNGSHFFNLLEYWLGPMQDAQVMDAGRLWENLDPEPDVRAVFEGGTVDFLAAREEHFSHYTIELLAANGRLRYEQGGRSVSWQPALPDMRFPGYRYLGADAETIPSGLDRYQWHVADQLAHALAGHRHCLCDGDEALATLRHMQTIIDMRSERN